ncbi:MAG: Flp pilus assembly protein CpaB [Phycisphaerae bacterium]|nr:Flp pilus assembly protein CpaB [Phycisphaerae bacterium]
MKSKAVIPLVLGLVVGLAALKLGVDAVQKAQGGQKTGPEIEVVVTTVDVGATMEIMPDAVVVKKTLDTPLLPPNAFNKIEDVVGRVTSKTIVAGTPISPALLAPKGTIPGLGVKIPEGYRAVSVKIDEVTGVAYQLLPNSFVDVLVVMDVMQGRKRETMSRVILQNIQIATVGQLRGDPSEESKAGSKPAKSVTLLIKAEDVPKLHLAQTKGKVTLAMRGSEDELITAESNALERELLGAKPDEEPQLDTSQMPKPSMLALGGKSPTPTFPSGVASIMMPEAQPENPPFTTTVINGPLGAGSAGQVIRVTYKNAKSMEVVEVSKGRTTGDSSSMRFGAGERQAGGVQERSPFTDRDRTARRRGARRDSPANQEDEKESFKETGE